MTAYYTTQHRPNTEARKLPAGGRTYYLRCLRSTCEGFFGRAFSATLAPLKADRMEASGRSHAALWSVLRIRPEVVTAVDMLKARYLANTGREVSQAEVLNALVHVAQLQIARDHPEFGQS
ncbi:hypothetical protein [Shimia sp. Alg240-R146]|uniref:hypothetical protein n=1 Tax=Shimia sp. Alg240-R146 TaxID=2993449 RepID=UPI0022E14DFD|nr:hypothetical protein [Shimia sp. Alg240-R146]